MAIGSDLRSGAVRCLPCPNRYARRIMLAKKVTPTGTPTPMPILATGDRSWDAAVELVLDPELVVVELVSEEAVETDDVIPEIVAVELVADGVLLAELELEVNNVEACRQGSGSRCRRRGEYWIVYFLYCG